MSNYMYGVEWARMLKFSKVVLSLDFVSRTDKATLPNKTCPVHTEYCTVSNVESLFRSAISGSYP